MTSNNPARRGTQPIPVIAVDERRAMDAFEVHQALLLAERRNRLLRENPQWQILRADAYEAFASAYEVLG